ncbi:hypothetical protein N9V88_03320 [bacterium]|nr:hypothetical protein [bacterium]|eukprot:COSAG01_NODE_2157_length_8280_cov_4.709204_3_plen_314_part_00
MSFALLGTLFFMSIATGTSCAQLFDNFEFDLFKPKRGVFSAKARLPTQTELLDMQKSRAQLVKQLQASVSVKMTGAPKIKGTIQVEFPERLRLKAGFLGLSELGVDVGSNDELFWIWVKASSSEQPEVMYYAEHGDYDRSTLRLSIPLDPKWLLDGLGLSQFSAQDRHVGPFARPDGKIELMTEKQSPAGLQRVVTLFDAKSLVIVQQALYNSEDKLVAYMNSSDHQAVNTNGRSIDVPKKIKIVVVEGNGETAGMTIQLGRISLDPLYGDPQKMWSLPRADGVPKVNLASELSVPPTELNIKAGNSGWKFQD